MKKQPQKQNRFLIFRKHTKKYIFTIKKWKSIRDAIIERDNYACRFCGGDAGEYSLHCHHIDWERSNNSNDNLVTLCFDCHRQVHLEQYKPCDHPDITPPWDR